MPNGNNTTSKCLIVDDEPMARDVIRRYIEKIPTLQLIGECGNATKSGSITTRQTISSIEAMLSDSEFIRIHRSFIVSINKISSFTHESVEIEKKQLPLGKYYLNNFLKLQE